MKATLSGSAIVLVTILADLDGRCSPHSQRRLKLKMCFFRKTQDKINELPKRPHALLYVGNILPGGATKT